MAAALYEPDLGYYARGTRQVGRTGDFFTSVSVGPVFGELLARRFLRDWRDRGEPARWRVIECGAHDGTLAADVLGTLRQLAPRAFEALEYVIPEPLASLQTAQMETLQSFGNRVRHLDNVSLLASEPLPGIAFGNEILDALPFHIIERSEGRWKETRVAVSMDGFVPECHEISDPELHAALQGIGGDFPNGYRSEIRTNFRTFLSPLAQALEEGLMIWADYGFARCDYYHPLRNSGTLRTFSKHKAGENPLSCPGGTDITAHVDFTAVAEAAALIGGRPVDFQNQGAWLTEIGREWLLDQEGNPVPASLRQFQTLTHPAQLGGSFQVLELSWKSASCPGLETRAIHRLFGDS